MKYDELIEILRHVGKDPSRLIFEDELTGIHNRRFFLSYLEHKVDWHADGDFPLSLLLIDLDGFKEINDSLGHDTGDQVLTWMATLLREVGGEAGLPVRFGGDEFILLLPRTSRDRARGAAERLLQRTRERPFRLREAGVPVPITLSIGIAAAPEDGRSSRSLFQSADTALYHAKQSGKDQAASAAEIDPNKVFSKTALHRLETSGIAGRNDELAVVSGALEELNRGNSRFLIFEGAPGMGKSTLLEAVERNVDGQNSFCVVKISGDPQEAYRPYYMTSRILINLLEQQEEKGADVLADLSDEELSYLAHVLPQLGNGSERPADEADAARRQHIFTSLAKLVPQLVRPAPLVLLIDDMHFADEATLLLLRVLIQRGELDLFICGTSLESLSLRGEGEAPPFDRFQAAHRKELGIRRIKLRPLGRDDIARYLRSVFPNLETGGGFEDELARMTQGNPLFLAEVIRKLVADGKVYLTGQEWRVAPLEEGYLPRSLEEVVTEKIADLDAEERQLLERASTMGEDIPVSVLTGSSDQDETRVLDFLDRAEALGLVKLDFHVNDEVMRFLGKRVLDISYNAIEEPRREVLHEEVGNYQERLYKKRLLPSASMLAYHYKRSANQEKARRYEQLQRLSSQAVFVPEEAEKYTLELLEDDTELEKRLEPESLPLVPNVLRAIMMAVRNIQLYPPESGAALRALSDVKDSVDAILERNERLHLSEDQRVLLVNGQRLDTSGFTAAADSFLELLGRAELQSILFQRGVTEEELTALMMTLGDLKPDLIHPGFWKNFALENRLRRLELRQRRYARVVRKKARGGPARAPTVEEEDLGPEELTRIQSVLRDLLGAAKSARLYPLDSEPVTRAVERLHGTLNEILSRRKALTLATADGALLVNGTRIDTAGFDALAASLLELIDNIGLSSLTFFANLPPGELETFVGALRDPPDPGIATEFWDDFARKHGLTHLAFNQRQYAVGAVQTLLSWADADSPEAVDSPGPGYAEQIEEEPSETLREALPRFGIELLIRGENKLIRRLLQRVFHEFQNKNPLERARTLQACKTLYDNLILGLQHKLTELAVDPLLTTIAEEEDPQVLGDLAILLYDMASGSVQFADYQLASRILLGIKARRDELAARDDKDAHGLARLLVRKLDSTAQKLLEDDLKSGQSERQEKAAQVVGSLGRPGIPLLVDVIKQEKDFRVRQMAASLLSEMGPQAAREIKRSLVTEAIVEQRFRVLEVIDTVTEDLRDELTYSLGDSNRKIRLAAFRLFERLQDDSLIELVLPFARDEDPDVAKGAIRSLAHLRSQGAVEALVSILETTKEPELAIACCLALGQIGDGAGVQALDRVLGQRAFLLFGRRWNEQVRATAAMALRQISDPHAAEILSRYKKDRATRVRQLARSAAESSG